MLKVAMSGPFRGLPSNNSDSMITDLSARPSAPGATSLCTPKLNALLEDSGHLFINNNYTLGPPCVDASGATTCINASIDFSAVAGGAPFLEEGAKSSTLCGTCGVLIRNTSNLAVHMRRHLQYRPYACSLCSYTGYDEEDVSRHINRAHGKSSGTAPGSNSGSKIRYQPEVEMEQSVTELIAASRMLGGAAGEEESRPASRSDCCGLDEAGTLANRPLATNTPVLQSFLKRELPEPVGNMATFQASVSELDPASGQAAAGGDFNFLKCQFCGQSVAHTPIRIIQHVKSHLHFAGYSCSLCHTGLEAKFETLEAFLAHLASLHADHCDFGTLKQYAERLLPNEILSMVELAFGPPEDSGAQLKCCLCSQQISWCDASVRSHVQQHVGYLPYQCTYCKKSFLDPKSLIAHMRSAHSNALVSIDLDLSFAADRNAQNLLAQCFPCLTPAFIEAARSETRGGSFTGSTAFVEPVAPEQAPDSVLSPASPSSETSRGGALAPTAGTTATGAYKCTMCLAVVPRNVISVVAHSKTHLRYSPLKCDHCGFRHHAIIKMRRHSSRSHPGLRFMVSYHPVPGIAKQVKMMMQKCFGTAMGASLTETDVDRLLKEEEGEVTPVNRGSLEFSSEQNLAPDSSGSVGELLRTLVSRDVNDASTPMKSANSMTALKGSPSLVPGSTGAYAAGSRDLSNQSASSMGESGNATGGFMSSVGKRMCLMCQTHIANNPSSFENHACKHIDYKPYHCQYCQYQSYIRGKVTRHIQQVHHGLPLKINHEPIPGIKEQILAIKYRCFPFLANLSAAGDEKSAAALMKLPFEKGEEFTCRACGAKVGADQSSLDDHLKRHVMHKVYYCPVCNFCNTQLLRVKQHINMSHADQKVTRILCCPPDGPQGLEKLRIRCFGPRTEDISAAGASVNAVAVGGSGAGSPDGSTRTSLSESNADDSLVGNGLGGHEEDEIMNDSVDSAIFDEELLPIDDGQCCACAVCGEVVANQQSALSSHARQHMDYKPYQCSFCAVKSVSENEIKMHIASSHPGSLQQVIYNPDQSQLMRMQQKCFQHVAAQRSNTQQQQQLSQAQVYHPPSRASLSHHFSPSLVRKLACNLCNQAIADNPKSVGIHVKNHLNYKPYRCPDCTYMSCEQSKARRHIEHVHGRSGEDLKIELQDEENIKERIAEMKASCFPNLGHVGPSEAYAARTNFSDAVTSSVDPDADSLPVMTGVGDLESAGWVRQPDPMEDALEYECLVCKQVIPTESADYHVRTHLGKPYKCGYCSCRFLNEAEAQTHSRNKHPNMELHIFYQGNQQDPDSHFNSVKRKCFPDLAAKQSLEASVGSSRSLIGGNLADMVASRPSSVLPMGLSYGDIGKVTCQICDQIVASNSNSMDVHVKNHLNFKPHQCGYCDYRSCIPGKVKRHLDTVHRGCEPKSYTKHYNASILKQISTELKSVCFPRQGELENPYVGRTKSELMAVLDSLKRQLKDDLHRSSMQNEQQQNEGGENADGSEAEGNSQARGVADPSLYGRISCQLCQVSVADNPTSLSLHARNHLGYKPYECTLCPYRSPIQAKVRRHLQNVHKLAGTPDQWTYSPRPEIRQQIIDTKLQCFPQLIEAAESAKNRQAIADADDDEPMEEEGSVSDFGAGLAGDEAELASDLASEPNEEKLTCELCWETFDADTMGDEVLSGTVLSHVETHMGKNHYRCGSCGFMHQDSSIVKQHIREEHENEAHKLIYAPADPSGDVQEWERRCFPTRTALDDSGHDSSMMTSSPTPLEDPDQDEGSLSQREDPDALEDYLDDGDEPEPDLDEGLGSGPAALEAGPTPPNSTPDGPRYICQMCSQPVSHYASSLYIHVKNHMNYKPYACGYCDYRSPVKSKVRRHNQNAHRAEVVRILYNPMHGIEREILAWKRKCFPEVTSFMPLANDKIPCRLCQTDVSDTLLSKTVHAKNHLNAKPYHCAYCTYKSCLKGETRRHINRQHVGMKVEIEFVEAEVATGLEIESTIAQCFNGGAALGAIEVTEQPKVPQASGPEVDLTDFPEDLSLNQVGTVEKSSDTSVTIKLGPAFREWHCVYCPFSATSKYHVKQHCISEHPGLAVTESNSSFYVTTDS